jgi:rhodanese-related sulfurtransferase
MRVNAILLILASAGCATDTSSREAHQLFAHGALLVDVRSPSEFAERRIAGSINIPVEDLQRRLSELPKRPLVVYCHTGVRAGFATSILRKAGFEVHNLGSIARWVRDPSGNDP